MPARSDVQAMRYAMSGTDHTGVDGKAFTIYQAFTQAALDHALEHVAWFGCNFCDQYRQGSAR
jgi:hypothetical protein